jgi:hypothetical protein
MSWSDHRPSDSIRPLASESLRVSGFNGLIFARMSWRARSTVIIFSISVLQTVEKKVIDDLIN